MLNNLGASLRIGVAPHAVGVLRVRRWGGAPATLLAEHVIAPSAEHPFDAIANTLRALLREQENVRGMAVTFVLADELARMWRVTPPPGAARLDDLEAAAALRFQSLYGEPPAAWQVGADWHVAQPFFAAALPRALLASLTLVADEFRLSIVGVEPHFVSAWNRWRRAIKTGAWFALAHDRLLTLAPIEDGAVRALRTVPIPDSIPDQAWLAHTLQREALLLDVAPPALLQACGAVPLAWTRPAAAGMIGCEVLDQPQPGGALYASAVAQLARGGAR